MDFLRAQIAFSGPTDFVHVADTAAAFVQCADGGPKGAHVFNLHGDTVDVVLAIEEECPAARGKLSIAGGHIPIPSHLDDGAIRSHYPDLPHTPLREGVRATIARFRELHAQGALDTRDLPKA